jgi:Family of unknown function (DUF6687)
MINRFLILSFGDPPPAAEKVIFCDGSGGRHFREGTDLELSHWRPNRTPRLFRADTSTEICFRFLDSPLPGDWTVAVNNHLDVDGILSVYVLVHSRTALARRREIVEAAVMGDFWGWGSPPAQRLFQGLTKLMNTRSASGVPTQAIYDEAFGRIVGLIDGTDSDSAAIDASLAPLHQNVQWVDQGRIRRSPIGERFSHYVVPSSVVAGDMERALRVPEFNEVISPAILFWPQARTKFDAERMCLVSIESPEGWFHDLWFPGYLWADTENRWRLTGMQHRNGMEAYDLTNSRMLAAVNDLQQQETATGSWVAGNEGSRFYDLLQGAFPLAVRFVDSEGQPAPSSLSPERVAAGLSAAFN